MKESRLQPLADDQPRRLRLTPGALQEVSSVLEDDIQLGLYVN